MTSAKTEEFSKVESGGFFKFEKIGDSITGTLSGSRFQESTVPGFKDQMIYTLSNVIVNDIDEGPGSERKVGFSKDYVISRMKKLSIGQRVKLAFESEYQTKENEKRGMKPSKNVEVYAGMMDETFKPSEPTSVQSPSTEDIPF